MKVKNLTIRDNRKGMSLLESVVAMTILSIVMLSIFEAFNFKMKADERSGMRTNALAFAENRIEELFKYPSSFDTVQLNAAIPPKDFISTQQGMEFTYHGATQPTDYKYIFERTYTVGVDPSDSRLRRYVVEVKYGSTKDMTKLPFKVVLTSSKGVTE